MPTVRWTAPIREDLPYRPIGPTTRARAEVATMLMNAHVAGRVRATIGRASDFYGPHARQSKAGDYIFAGALAGKPAQALGNPDIPHTNTGGRVAGGCGPGGVAAAQPAGQRPARQERRFRAEISVVS